MTRDAVLQLLGQALELLACRTVEILGADVVRNGGTVIDLLVDGALGALLAVASRPRTAPSWRSARAAGTTSAATTVVAAPATLAAASSTTIGAAAPAAARATGPALATSLPLAPPATTVGTARTAVAS